MEGGSSNKKNWSKNLELLEILARTQHDGSNVNIYLKIK